MSVPRDRHPARLRVLFVSERLMRGGLQEVMVAIATGMRARGHEVTCFVNRPIDVDNPYARALREAGVPVFEPFDWADAAARRVTLSWLAFAVLSPVLLPAAVLDAWMRRRPLVRSVVGVHGRLRG